MNNGFTLIITTSSIRTILPSGLILRQDSTIYTPQLGSNLILQFSSTPYVPPISL